MVDYKNIQIQRASQVEYEPRRAQHNGREHLIVPVVMMVEGVHNGSAGPILHLPEHFSQNPADWNGVPVTNGHPEVDGQYVLSDQAPQEEWVVGFIANARVEDGKLKAEVWVDVVRALAVNVEIVNYINEGKPFDVSTGALTRDVPKNGQHNGEDYQAITMGYQPDHLALLPGERGACSWSDGCGIRNNKQKEDKDGMSELKNYAQGRKALIREGQFVLNGLQDNEVGFLELSSKIQNQLDRLDSEARIHFLKEIYDSNFVYEVRDRDSGTQRFYRQEFVQDNGEVELSGDPQEVRRNVEFVPVQNNQQENNSEDCGCNESGLKRTKFTNNNSKDTEASMSTNDKPSGEVMDRVVSLINNEDTRFSKADREWLLNLNEDQLSKLEPVEPKEPEVTREQALQALADDLSDTEKLKEILPDSTKSKFETGLKAYQDQREKLVKSIQANTAEGTWPNEELESMTLDNLGRLAKSVQKTDYSGNGPADSVTNNAEGETEMLLPAGVELES